jgi:hypothetical protein
VSRLSVPNLGARPLLDEDVMIRLLFLLDNRLISSCIQTEQYG